MKICKKIIILIAMIIMTITSLNIKLYAAGNSRGTLTYKKLSGKDRFATSILIAKETYPRKAKNVILINGNNPIDGIPAITLANKLSAPIILTHPDKLSSELKNEIKNLKTEKVYLIGGTATISNKVETQLNTMGISVERVYGSTRYSTAIEIAEKVRNFDSVVICNSGDNGVNGAAVSGIAAQNQMPILYNDSVKQLNDTTYNFVKKYAKTIYMIGNKMSSSQEEKLNDAGIEVINVEMINKFGAIYNKVVLINNPIDAISVSYFAAKNKALYLYTNNTLTENQKDVIANNDISKIYYAGGGKIKGPVKEIIRILKNESTIENKINLNKSKVVFYIPHQDDESSYFSQTILKAMAEKGAKNVYIVMLTDGANSDVNISRDNEHYAEVKRLLAKYELTFTEARDNEFLAACKSLGFKESNIYFNEEINGLTRLKDGSANADDIKRTMLYFEKKFKGDVTHITYSFKYETHNDHEQAGKALNELYYDLTIPEETFMSAYFVVRANYDFKDGEINDKTMFTLTEMNFSDRIINALNKYKGVYHSNDIQEVRLGIGYRSAPDPINKIMTKARKGELSTKIHLPS